MLTNFLRLMLTLSNAYAGHPQQADAIHETAHVLCERLVYSALAPTVDDDAIHPVAEPVAEALCRWELPGEPWAR